MFPSAGIGEDTPDPSGGSIIQGHRAGIMFGIFVNTVAQAFIDPGSYLGKNPSESFEFPLLLLIP